MAKRVKKHLVKFLEIDQLEKLQEPLVEKFKNALIKGKMNKRDITAIRDITVLTLVYSCALRISEATNLLLINLDMQRQYIRIVDSKGDDRMVYVPDGTIKLIKKWLEVRPKNDNPYLFCNVKGSTKPDVRTGKEPNVPLGRDYFNKLISKLADETGVRMAGGTELSKPHPHTLRHTRAMNYMDNGVELNVIQKLLGHKNIGTTQVYAHVRQEVADNVQRQSVAGIVDF